MVCKMIVYVHGWRTSGIETGKILKDYFGEDQVIVPVLEHTPLADFDRICRLAEEHDAAIIGSSLGGFYAYCVAAMLNRKAILINPSFDPYNRLTEYGEFKKYDCDDTFEWTPIKNKTLSILADSARDCEIRTKNYHFFVAKDDELIDHSWIKNIFPNVNEYDNCGHRFTRMEDILPKIKDIHDLHVDNSIR